MPTLLKTWQILGIVQYNVLNKFPLSVSEMNPVGERLQGFLTDSLACLSNLLELIQLKALALSSHTHCLLLSAKKLLDMNLFSSSKLEP